MLHASIFAPPPHTARLRPQVCSLTRDVHRLAGIPGVLITGRLDISSPPDIAWRLATEWPDAELLVVEDAGHGTSGPSMTVAIVFTARRFSGA